MASNRHLGRIIALQTLYEQDFRRDVKDESFDLKSVLERNLARYASTLDDVDFVRDLVNGVIEKSSELTTELQPLAPEWPFDSIARIDRILLLMGLFELRFSDSVPPKVVINEAVELAKAFGAENSSKFINGVLGSALKNILTERGESLPETKQSDDQLNAKKEQKSEEAEEVAEADDKSVKKSSSKQPKPPKEKS